MEENFDQKKEQQGAESRQDGQMPKFTFCPDCGALMKDGTCPDCSKRSGENGNLAYDRSIQGGQYSQPWKSNSPFGSAVNEPGRNERGNDLGNRYPQGHPYDQKGTYSQGNPYGQGGVYPQGNPYGQGGVYPQGNPYSQGGMCPQDNPYSNGYGSYPPGNWNSSPYPYGSGMPNAPRKEDTTKHIWITVGISALTAIFILLLAACIFFMHRAGAVRPFMGNYGSRIEVPGSDTGNEDAPWRDSSGSEMPSDGNQEGKPDDSSSEGTENQNDASDDAEKETYIPSASDKYYKELTTYINENVSYQFTMDEYSDNTETIDVLATYYQMEGNIPNLEALNEHIKNTALYFAKEFPQQAGIIGSQMKYSAYITPYVTYNDENIVSIVFNQYVTVDTSYVVQLAPINIDIKNGVVLDNVGILNVDEAFAADFIKRSNAQNGEISFFTEMNTKQLQDLLTNGANLILYYTPLGMEVGLNYSDQSSSGWVTVTYKDYEKYLSKF